MNSAKKLLKNYFPNIFYLLRDVYRLYMHNKRKNVPKDKYEYYVGQKYKKVFGVECDFSNPKKYSEKIQWLKLYDNSVLRTKLTDKVAVREWIADTIGKEYLIPLIGIYDDVSGIDFDALPNEFVIKMSHGSGWNIVVKEKKRENINQIKRKINKWMKLNYAFWNVFEIHYESIQPRIVIEKYVSDKYGALNDYKFLCFDGEIKYFWIDFDRYSNHKRNLYDMKWNLQPWNQMKYGNYEGEVVRPKNFDDMVSVANRLCQGFKHVRVDLYNVDGKIYFGEMTFTNGSGYEGIYPEEYDYMLGEYIRLPIDEGCCK